MSSERDGRGAGLIRFDTNGKAIIECSKECNNDKSGRWAMPAPVSGRTMLQLKTERFRNRKVIVEIAAAGIAVFVFVAWEPGWDGLDWWRHS